MTTLILCGGAGSRLWPLSRQKLPKQFYPLVHGNSLFSLAVNRNKDNTDTWCVAVNSDQDFLAFAEFKTVGITAYHAVIEPVGRNTAPAIALAALGMDREETILVIASDHIISNQNAYSSAVNKAQELAGRGKLVTFGIQPTRPETGYGYIEHHNGEVVSFREKPDTQTAERYLREGRYLWNSGMFCFKAGVFLDELKTYRTDVYDTCVRVYNAAYERSHSLVIKPTREEMESIPSVSIDYAVMEHSKNVSVVPCDIGWSDLGSFESLKEAGIPDNNDNVISGHVNFLSLDSKNNFIFSNGNKQIVLIDIDDAMIVDTEDALLVAKHGSGQRVKEAFDELRVQYPQILLEHTTVLRPWGSYTVLLDTDRVKVKRLVVNPGHRISLQKHQFRQEHWVCVDGRGIVTIDNKEVLFERSIEVHIPSGSIHRLACNGHDPLIVIETQIGTYFGEDDIIRLEDDYLRIKS